MKYTRIGPVLLLVFAASWAAACDAQSPAVKQSGSGICHTSESPWFDRTKNFVPFPSIEACLAAGGRLPRGVAPSNSRSDVRDDYERDHFGSGWADEDGDCQNSRQEALAAQSTAPVRFDKRGCRVVAGRWISPFTGKAIHNPAAIDIDHVVPLKWAWDHGASEWSQDKREQFANDPVNLISVERSLNRSKGAKGILEWLPPSGQCQYVLRFMRVLKLYGFVLVSQQREAHDALRKRICE
ncbi:HNH endonuclease [Proteobacteria bacterium 005FR1]|nr:HNH endonuclease [Proteobacteria bacterium 005FR1]